ncbi:MAG TPA: UbiA family prenyltransferase, partial [Anaerolineales bacterium]|nr:UbiA family prenyltransferase [Anaerolineales bacterium]
MKTFDHPAEAKRLPFWHLTKQFIHLRRYAFTVFLPLMGAATADGDASLVQILLIILTAFQFHLFTYIFNDVIDLPVDRFMEKRADHPLVRGDMSPRTALFIALIQVPLVLFTTWFVGLSLSALAALIVALLFMAVYDLWGKKNPFPPATDLIQALSWGSLTLYGAWVVGSPGILTYFLAAIFAVFILLMNGVFEGVIDIEEDSKANLKTTAMIFGVRRRGENELPFIPTSLLVYCLVLEAVLSALNLIPLAVNYFGYSPNLRTILLAVVIALNLAIVWLSVKLVLPSERLRLKIKDEHIDLMSIFSILILLVAYMPSL